MSYDRDSSYNDGMYYAKGSMRGGRMGYSRDDASEHLMRKAEEMLNVAGTEKERKAIHHFIKMLEDD